MRYVLRKRRFRLDVPTDLPSGSIVIGLAPQNVVEQLDLNYIPIVYLELLEERQESLVHDGEDKLA